MYKNLEVNIIQLILIKLFKLFKLNIMDKSVWLSSILRNVEMLNMQFLTFA